MITMHGIEMNKYLESFGAVSQAAMVAQNISLALGEIHAALVKPGQDKSLITPEILMNLATKHNENMQCLDVLKEKMENLKLYLEKALTV